MSLFCFLVVPLFAFFYLTLRESDNDRLGIEFAIIFGCLAGILRCFSGDLVTGDVPGFWAWLHAFLDRSALPAVLPFVAWVILGRVRGSRFTVSAEEFSFVWLSITAALFSVRFSVSPMAQMLMLVPLLWIALAIALPLVWKMAEEELGFMSILAYALVGLLPLAAATASWAFWSQYRLLAWGAFAVTMAPAVWSVLRDALSGSNA